MVEHTRTADSALQQRPLAPDDVGLHRDVRLRALSDAPTSFGETSAEHADRPWSYWEELTRSVPDAWPVSPMALPEPPNAPPPSHGQQAMPTIGLAISGGGFRATAFSLGALLYLVDRGINNRVRYIASVSGGSVANGYVAQECDFTTVDVDDFEKIVHNIGRTMALRGIITASPIISLLISTTIAVASLFLAIVMVGSAALRFTIVLLSLVLLSVLIQLRGDALSLALGHRFFRTHHSFTRMRELCNRGARHALIATDLAIGTPVYIEPEWIHGPGIGYGKSDDLYLHTAVRWSSGVPFLVPPGRVRAERFRFEGAIRTGTDEYPRPRYQKWVVMVDGGVSNNLGSDYHDITTPATFGTREQFYSAPAADDKITIDASGSLRPSRLRFAGVPLIGELLALVRGGSVMYENTLRPRTQRLRGLISIHQAPLFAVNLATTLYDREPRGDVAAYFRRLRGITGYLREHLETHHDEQEAMERLGESSAQVPTTFGALGEDVVALLLWHGYLNAMVVCYAELGVEPPENLCNRTRYYFRRLVARDPKAVADPWSHLYPRHGCAPRRALQQGE